MISLQLYHRLSDDEDGDSDSEEPFLNSFEEIDKLDKKTPAKVTAKVVYVSEEKITRDNRDDKIYLMTLNRKNINKFCTFREMYRTCGLRDHKGNM